MKHENGSIKHLEGTGALLKIQIYIVYICIFHSFSGCGAVFLLFFFFLFLQIFIHAIMVEESCKIRKLEKWSVTENFATGSPAIKWRFRIVRIHK